MTRLGRAATLWREAFSRHQGISGEPHLALQRLLIFGPQHGANERRIRCPNAPNARAFRPLSRDMKIATFNINNVRKRLPNLLEWMRESSPDVVCLQELKATDAEFPVAATRT
jgi:Endonuclease/Exonuclease/phosphatase family